MKTRDGTHMNGTMLLGAVINGGMYASHGSPEAQFSSQEQSWTTCKQSVGMADGQQPGQMFPGNTCTVV